MIVYLTYNEYKTGGEPESDDEWCSYSPTYIDWQLTGAYLNNKKLHWMVEQVEVENVKAGDYIYVVYVRYSTGNSFGRTHGVWAIQGVYKTPEEAQAKQAELDADSKVEWDYDKHETYKPWKGYFESYECCEVAVMLVK